ALGNGLEAVAAVFAGEEQMERHTVADLPEFRDSNTQSITHSESRLHTLTEMTEYSEYTSSFDSITDHMKSESEHHTLPDFKEVDPPDIIKEVDSSENIPETYKEYHENKESNIDKNDSSSNVHTRKSQSPVSNKVASFFIGDEQGVSESQDLIPEPSDMQIDIDIPL
ncbi:unnamed protein product, partial [Meganyctiphanes norvegica]